MIVKTNVKINLGLSVLRKRDDGFHDIETLFVPCHGYGDTIEIITGDDYSRTSAKIFAKYSPMVAQEISGDGKLMITIGREEGVDWNPLDDLCAKAYNILAQDFELPPVKIFLEKTAPVGAGLGGGSADAAFTLKALNEMFGLGLLNDASNAEGKPSLSEYAARLGADCAFFIFNRPMIGSGKGNILQPFEYDGMQPGHDGLFDSLGLELKVLVPEGIVVSTAEAYKGIHPREELQSCSESADSGRESIAELLERPVEEWKDCLVNDFEETVFKAHPELALIKQSLYDSGAVYASMSGSGSALFALYRK